MGIISLKDKKNTVNPFNTTGKQPYYHSAKNFQEALFTPKMTGKYHMFVGDNDGAFGIIWQNADGTTVNDRIWKSTSGSTFSIGATYGTSERKTKVQTSNYTNWYNWEIDLTGLSPGRVVFYVRRDFYTWDMALDDIQIQARNGTVINLDPSVGTVRSSNLWKTQGYVSSPAIDSRNDAITNIPSSWVNLSLSSGSSGATGGRYNYNKGTTSSGGTGPDNAADNNNNTYYLYPETSGGTVWQAIYLTTRYYYNINTGASSE